MSVTLTEMVSLQPAKQRRDAKNETSWAQPTLCLLNHFSFSLSLSSWLMLTVFVSAVIAFLMVSVSEGPLPAAGAC